MKETRELIIFVFELLNGVGHSLDDGKIDVFDSGNFIAALGALPPALNDATLIPSELSDMSDAQKQELVDLAIERFDIPQDNVEMYIERALKIGIELASFVADLMAASKGAKETV